MVKPLAKYSDLLVYDYNYNYLSQLPQKPPLIVRQPAPAAFKPAKVFVNAVKEK